MSKVPEYGKEEEQIPSNSAALSDARLEGDNRAKGEEADKLEFEQVEELDHAGFVLEEHRKGPSKRTRMNWDSTPTRRLESATAHALPTAGPLCERINARSCSAALGNKSCAGTANPPEPLGAQLQIFNVSRKWPDANSQLRKHLETFELAKCTAHATICN